MKKILILFAHPAMEKSRVNEILIDGIDQIENVTFHDLYQEYPAMDFDIEYEQQLLEEHDIIIFQHPFFWYSAPAILKEYVDIVFTHGWAYGSQGQALQGKLFFNVITAGGGKKAYCDQGYNHFTIRQLLAPIEQTMNLCRLIFMPPYVVHGTHSIEMETVKEHKEAYHSILKQFQSGALLPEDVVSLQYLNELFITKS